MLLKCRLLVDKVVVVNEFVDLAKKSKKSCITFKVVLYKNYDLVSYFFMDYMLVKFSFDGKWRGCIHT